MFPDLLPSCAQYFLLMRNESTDNNIYKQVNKNKLNSKGEDCYPMIVHY
jgi:hypothetical protein